MKKIFALAAFCVLFAATGTAQDKKLKFGLRVTPGLNFYNPSDAKEIAKDGSVLNFGWGGAVEINIGDNAAIVTGLEVLNTGGRIAYLDSAIMTLQNGDIVQVNKDGSLDADTSGSGFEYYLVNSRRFRANYVHLPFSIKAKTNEIGYLTYFGQFGLNTAINTKGRSTDQVRLLGSGTNTELDDMNVDTEVQPVKFNLQVGGGAEYNLSGSTSLVFSIHYNHGFSNILKGNSKNLRTTDGRAFEQTVYERGATLAIGILF